MHVREKVKVSVASYMLQQLHAVYLVYLKTNINVTPACMWGRR